MLTSQKRKARNANFDEAKRVMLTSPSGMDKARNANFA